MTLRILVTGAEGLVGTALSRTEGTIGLSRRALDITDAAQVRAALIHHRPDAVINAAAQANVNLAEDEPSLTFLVNAGGPAILADACADLGVRLVHISTDYVLNGPNVPGLRLTERRVASPQSTYARAKLEGEAPVLATGGVVARVQWVYAPGRRGFFASALQRLAVGECLPLVSDQVGCPTPAPLVAHWLRALACPDLPTGLVHLATAGEATPAQWLGAAATTLGLPFRMRPIRRVDLGGAVRPARSCLSHRRAHQRFGMWVPSWGEALDRLLRGLPVR